MSFSHDMVKAYVKDKLARAVSPGIIMGTTSTDEGHGHKFAVLYDEHNGMFIGETSYDGQGPHTHYIMLGKYDVQKRSKEMALNDPQQPRGDLGVVEIPDSNLPQNLAELLVFWNLKEIVLATSPAFPNDHVHTLVMRFAGKTIDRMGRKIEAEKNERSAFSLGLEAAGLTEDANIAKKKALREAANLAVLEALNEANEASKHPKKDKADKHPQTEEEASKHPDKKNKKKKKKVTLKK